MFLMCQYKFPCDASVMTAYLFEFIKFFVTTVTTIELLYIRSNNNT